MHLDNLPHPLCPSSRKGEEVRRRAGESQVCCHKQSTAGEACAVTALGDGVQHKSKVEKGQKEAVASSCSPRLPCAPANDLPCSGASQL